MEISEFQERGGGTILGGEWGTLLQSQHSSDCVVFMDIQSLFIPEFIILTIFRETGNFEGGRALKFEPGRNVKIRQTTLWNSHEKTEENFIQTEVH